MTSGPPAEGMPAAAGPHLPTSGPRPAVSSAPTPLKDENTAPRALDTGAAVCSPLTFARLMPGKARRCTHAGRRLAEP